MRYNGIMEKKIKEYEKFIAKAAKEKMTAEERKRLGQYHFEMLESFQHERLIHLVVTLFFAMITVTFLFIAAWTTVAYDLRQEMMPLYILSIILAVLTGFYVRHYYFLENRIQELYKYTREIAGI